MSRVITRNFKLGEGIDKCLVGGGVSVRKVRIYNKKHFLIFLHRVRGGGCQLGGGSLPP